MDCITTAVSRGTDTPGRPGKVTALDFLYQVKTHRHWDFRFCFLLLVLWDDSTKTVELTSKMKSVFLSQNIPATWGFFKLKKKKKERKTLPNTVQCKYGYLTYCKIPNFFDPILLPLCWQCLLSLVLYGMTLVIPISATVLSTLQSSQGAGCGPWNTPLVPHLAVMEKLSTLA